MKKKFTHAEGREGSVQISKHQRLVYYPTSEVCPRIACTCRLASLPTPSSQERRARAACHALLDENGTFGEEVLNKIREIIWREEEKLGDFMRGDDSTYTITGHCYDLK